MGTRAEIVQKCLNAAEHSEQCFNFEIQYWLDKYENCKNEEINFSEAAFLIYSVARIYGRKVDYLEKVLLEFNQRGAADVKAAAADPELLKNSDATNGDETIAKTAPPKVIEKPKRGSKKVLKPTGRIKFKPKEFTIAPVSQISLCLDENARNDGDEFDDDQLRMKNVFPRINILQSNLQNNNTFFDNLGIGEKDCDNVDTLRDYRMFMDTIDQPMRTDHRLSKDENIMNVDPAADGNRSKVLPNHRKQCKVYLSAAYLKEKYNVDLQDNSDYLNMLRYDEEIKRLHLDKMSIEELGHLKVGAYLNDILHGTADSAGYVPVAPVDSGIDVSEPNMDNSTSDMSSSLQNTTELLESTVEMDTTNPPDESMDITDEGFENRDSLDISGDTLMNSSMEESTHHSILNCTENATATTADTTFDALKDTTGESLTLNPVDTSAEPIDQSNMESDTNKPTRESLDDGIGCSIVNSPSGDLEPPAEMRDIFSPVNVSPPEDMIIDVSGPVMDLLRVDGNDVKKIELKCNIFEIPEALLRRPKIFKLAEDFNLWIAARKRKSLVKLEATTPKLFKMMDGRMVMVSPIPSDNQSCISENVDFLGFDEFGNISAVSSLDLTTDMMRCSRTLSTEPTDFHGFCEDQEDDKTGLRDLVANISGNGEKNGLQPASIESRSFSHDSGIVPEKSVATEMDSGVADLDNFSTIESSVLGGEVPQNITAAEQNDTVDKQNSAPTEADSGFSEVDSLLQSEANEQSSMEPSTIEVAPLEDTNITEDNPTSLIETSLPEMLRKDDDEIFKRPEPIASSAESNHDDKSNQEEEQCRNDEMRDMVQRVSKWHSMLRPILAESEKRNNFNIHELGSDIINLFPPDEPSKEITFSNVMENRDESYTARYFLSLLLLTNTKNVHISVEHPHLNGKVVCKNDDVKIKLLSRTRHLDEVNNINKHLPASKRNKTKDREDQNSQLCWLARAAIENIVPYTIN